MSTTVDSRVVEMKFDNKDFESNVQTSLSTLDKLKQKLNLSDSAKGLEKIGDAAKDISFDKIADGVAYLEKRFSTFGIVSMRVIQNLTDSTMRLGSKLFNFISDGIIQGGINRSANLENAHFQLQGLLKDEEKVQAVMKNVNDSVDGTAYSLDSAAKVASQFAASGMKAGNEMFTSLRAVAGVAAMTNSSYDDIGQIFTQVAGNGRLMGDQLLQLSARGMNAAAVLTSYFNGINDGSIKASDSVTKAVKEVSGGAKVTEGDIRDFVSKGKVSFDIFAAAMDDSFGEHAKKANETFTGAFANMKAALARIGAGFISPLIVQNGALVGLFNTLRERINDFKKAIVFDEAIGNVEALSKRFTDAIINIANASTNFFAKLDVTEPVNIFYNLVDSLVNIFKVLQSVFNPVRDAFREVFPPTAAKQLTSISQSIKDFTSNLILSDDAMEKVKNVFIVFFSILKTGGNIVADAVRLFGRFIQTVLPIGTALLNFIANIAGKIVELRQAAGKGFNFKPLKLLESLLSRIQIRTFWLTDGITKVGSKFLDVINKIKIVPFLKTIGKHVSTLSSGIITVIGKVATAITNKLSNINFDKFLDFINALSFGTIAVSIGKFLNNFGKFSDVFKDIASISDLKKGITKTLDSIRDSISAFQENMKAETLSKIAKSIAILAGALLVLSLIDSDKLSSATFAMTTMFAELLGAMAIFEKISDSSKKTQKAANAMIKIAVAMLILSSALKKLGGMSWDEISRGVVGVAGLSLIMVGVARILSSGGTKITKGVASLILFAEAIKILAKACSALATLSWDELKKGLVGVATLIGGMTLFTRLAKFDKGSISAAINMVALATAIRILASSCKVFASMDYDELKRGLLGVAVLITVLTVAVNHMPKNMVGIGIGLVVVGAAMEILANVLNKLKSFSAGDMRSSLVMFGSSLVILAAALNMMRGTVSGSLAMIIAAGALAILAPVLAILGKMSWESIAKGLVTLGGAFLVIGVAGALLGPLLPVIAGLSLCLLTVSAAITLAGIGFLALGAGIAAFATALSVGAAEIVAGITVIATGLAGLIPMIASQFAKGIASFLVTLMKSATEIGEALKELLLMALGVLKECAPEIADTALTIISEVLKSLASHAPEIVDSLMKFLIGIIRSVGDNLPELIQAAVYFVGQFLSGVVNALKDIDPDSLLKGIVAVGLLTGLMFALSAVLPAIPGAMAGVVGLGIVVAELSLVLAAIGALAQIPGLSWLIGEGGRLLEQIGVAIGNFIGGIIGGIASGVTGQLPEIGNDLSDFMTSLQPFISGTQKINESSINGVRTLAEAILMLTGGELLSGITSWITGKSSITEFGEELSSLAKSFGEFSTAIPDIDESKQVSIENMAKMLQTFASLEIPNSGGLLGLVTGNNDIDQFGSMLSSFAKSFKEYLNNIPEITEEHITAAKNMIELLSALTSVDIPNSGGLLSLAVGDNDLGKFGSMVSSLAKSFSSYVNDIPSIDESVVTSTQNLVKMLQALANLDIPNTGGLVAMFSGNNNLTVFGNQIKSFIESVSGLDTSGVSNVSKTIGEISKIAETVGKLDGSKMTTFAKTLSDFGKSIGSSFAASVNSSSSNVSKAGEALILKFISGVKSKSSTLKTSISTIITSAVSGITKKQAEVTTAGASLIEKFVNGINSKKTAVSSAVSSTVSKAASTISSKIGSFTSVGVSLMTKLTSGINSKKTGISSAFVSVVNNALTSIKSKFSGFSSTGGNLITVFASGINSKSSIVIASFTTLMSKGLNLIKSKYGSFNSAGQSLVNAISAGMRSKSSSVSSAMSSAVSSGASSARSYYSSYYSAGSYIGEGFVAGIRSKIAAARAAGSALASAGGSGITKTAAIRSPSRVTTKFGEYFGQGWVNAILSFVSKARNAGSKMSQAAISGMSNAISQVSNILDGDFDYQPQIRPVLDLSNVETGMALIDGMLPAPNISASLDDINRIGRFMDKASDMDFDIVTAINKLAKKLDTSSGNTYIIDGITYDDGSGVSDAIGNLIRIANIERRI